MVVKRVLLIASVLLYIAITNIALYNAIPYVDEAACEYILELECEQEAEEEKKDFKEQFIDLSSLCFGLFFDSANTFSYRLKNSFSISNTPYKPPIVS